VLTLNQKKQISSDTLMNHKLLYYAVMLTSTLPSSDSNTNLEADQEDVTKRDKSFRYQPRLDVLRRYHIIRGMLINIAMTINRTFKAVLVLKIQKYSH